jgi:hypothetical protein
MGCGTGEVKLRDSGIGGSDWRKRERMVIVDRV